MRAIIPLRDGKTVLTGSQDGEVRRWQIHFDDPLRARVYVADSIESAAWANDSKELFLGLHDGEIKSLDLSGHRE